MIHLQIPETDKILRTEKHKMEGVDTEPSWTPEKEGMQTLIKYSR